MLTTFIMLPGYMLTAVPGGIVGASFINVTNAPVRDGCCPRCGIKVCGVRQVLPSVWRGAIAVVSRRRSRREGGM